MTVFDKELIAAALEVRLRAYAPYSKFLVGAAFRGASGQIYAGSNVENLSYGLTNCAERVAIGTAVSAGERKFTALVVATTGGVAPCGACRQVLVEFADDLPILLVDADAPEKTRRTSLAELLPTRFEADL